MASCGPAPLCSAATALAAAECRAADATRGTCGDALACEGASAEAEDEWDAALDAEDDAGESAGTGAADRGGNGSGSMPGGGLSSEARGRGISGMIGDSPGRGGERGEGGEDAACAAGKAACVNTGGPSCEAPATALDTAGEDAACAVVAAEPKGASAA